MNLPLWERQLGEEQMEKEETAGFPVDVKSINVTRWLRVSQEDKTICARRACGAVCSEDGRKLCR